MPGPAAGQWEAAGREPPVTGRGREGTGERGDMQTGDRGTKAEVCGGPLEMVGW